MTSAAASALAINRALETVMREDKGRLISALIAKLRNFELAEEALQEAMTSAFVHWSRNGLPSSPQGWLLKVAWRKAIDRIRRNKTQTNVSDAMKVLAGQEFADDPEDIPDERLRLIFTCCHPALEQKSRVALTLRTICGLSTGEVARAFLDQETTMGQRLTRAKGKIAAAGIPFAVPDLDALPERLHGVLAVIYLVFNAGYTPNADLTRDLAGEAIFLARLVNRLCPEQPEVEGCLALMLLTNARRKARLDEQGAAIALGDQDRDLWDKEAIGEGLALIDRAMHRLAPGPYQIKAAISACHMADGGPDWPQIVALYDSLLRHEPTPIVQLNCAVAIAETGSLEIGLRLLEMIAKDLQDYQPFHAAQADLLARAGQSELALQAYDKAIELATSEGDILFLKRRRDKLGV
jgi:RNA polymerase sigma factor (sigma-70 family)